LSRRLEEFRNNNTDDSTVLNYFDELEIHPLSISVEDQDTERILSVIMKHVGKPHNYGLSPEQMAEKRKIEEERLAKELEQQEIEKEKKNKEEDERHQKAVEDWKIKLAEVRKQEQDVLEAQSLPLRSYLMKHVMPTVSAGLVELCKVRPEDPIDYLAEFLFKHNPDNA
jgi:adenylate kinase